MSMFRTVWWGVGEWGAEELTLSVNSLKGKVPSDDTQPHHPCMHDSEHRDACFIVDVLLLIY